MSITYFESLMWISAGLAAVLLFTYPVQVTAFFDTFAWGTDNGFKGTRTYVAYVFLGGTITIVAYSITTGSLTVPSNSASWEVIVGLTFIGTVIPLVLFTEGLARIEASRASILSTCEPLTTVLLGVVLLDEVLTVSIVIGALLIISGAIGTASYAEQLIRNCYLRLRVDRRANQ